MTPLAHLGQALLAHPQMLTLLQQNPPVDVPAANPVAGLAGGAVTTFLTTLIVGAIMVALAPEYTRARMAGVLEEPVGTFLYGLVALVALFVVAVLLAITVVGLVLAVPLLILAYVVWAVGSAIAFLAIGDRFVGHEDGWTKALLVAAGINGLLTLTGIGGIVSFCVGAAGFGAVLRSYFG